MTLPDRSRSLLATVVGWALTAVVVWLLLRFVVGTVGFVLRGVLVIVVIVGLLWAYVTLKTPND
jgi:hypothetical protein